MKLLNGFEFYDFKNFYSLLLLSLNLTEEKVKNKLNFKNIGKGGKHA